MGKNSYKVLVYDFDGVMTDNKVYVDQHGNEIVQVNRADGLGVSEIMKLGIRQMILSNTLEDRKEALAKILPYQRNDFVEIFLDYAYIYI